MTFTRDSLVWVFGLIGSIIVGLSTFGDLTQIGIPGSWIPKIRGLAFVVGIISAYAKASPLPLSYKSQDKLSQGQGFQEIPAPQNPPPAPPAPSADVNK